MGSVDKKDVELRTIMALLFSHHELQFGKDLDKRVVVDWVKDELSGAQQNFISNRLGALNGRELKRLLTILEEKGRLREKPKPEKETSGGGEPKAKGKAKAKAKGPVQG